MFWPFRRSSPNLPKDYKKYLDPHAVQIVQELQSHGFESYLVGGCVRDVLLKKKPKDFDIATRATPQQVKALIKRSFIIGKRFRIVVAKRNWKNSELVPTDHGLFPWNLDVASEKEFQITTFRRDPVVVNGVTNENVFGSAQEDALRRDFTINALFLDPLQGKIVDFVGGLQDLQRKILRIIGEPVLRVQEDPIRILRALRFAARANLGFEGATHAALIEGLPLLADAKKERTREEILKCMKEGSAEKAFVEFGKLEIWKYVAPSLHRHLQQVPQAEERLLKTCAKMRETRWTHPREAAPLFLLLLQDFYGLSPLNTYPSGPALESVLEELKVSKAEREQIQRIRQSLARLCRDPQAQQASRIWSQDAKNLLSWVPVFYVFKILADMGYGAYPKAWQSWGPLWKEKISSATHILKRQFSTSSTRRRPRRPSRRRRSST